jgi:hypothetical protein
VLVLKTDQLIQSLWCKRRRVLDDGADELAEHGGAVLGNVFHFVVDGLVKAVNDLDTPARRRMV